MYISNNNNLSLDDMKKISYEVFLNIGQSLCSDPEIFVNFEEDKKKLEIKKNEILKQIEILTESNKKLSDKIKQSEIQLKKKSSFLSLLSKTSSDKYKDFTTNQRVYNETFEKISELYEEIIEINDELKKIENNYI